MRKRRATQALPIIVFASNGGQVEASAGDIGAVMSSWAAIEIHACTGQRKKVPALGALHYLAPP